VSMTSHLRNFFLLDSFIVQETFKFLANNPAGYPLSGFKITGYPVHHQIHYPVHLLSLLCLNTVSDNKLGAISHRYKRKDAKKLFEA
jgi:hypothetical protein